MLKIFRRLKAIKLNKDYRLILCDPKDKDALNAFTFVAPEEWVINNGKGERFGTAYTTLYWEKQKIHHEFRTPKAAIQHTLIYKSPKRLRDTYFIIEKI